MSGPHYLDTSYEARVARQLKRWRWASLHLDPVLLFGLLLLTVIGLVNLYSASLHHGGGLVSSQLRHYLAAFLLLFVTAQIPPRYWRIAAPWLFGLAFCLLLLVFLVGHSSQGAKRWLGVGHVMLQPSELMKLAMPMMMAWLLQTPTSVYEPKRLFISAVALGLPVCLIAKQPDLGTAILIALSGGCVLLLAGIDRRWLVGGLVLAIIAAPVLWHVMHDYQQQRVMTFLNPASDPLGSGYNIIQSKIAIGSGGWFGKGYLHGTQSHLSFLPSHTTDFIFSVGIEEWGFFGALLLTLGYSCVFARASFIALQAQDHFSRLFIGSLSVVFILGALINMGMVVGLLPVVGVPLPFMSYGGSSMMSMMIAFGMMMSSHTNKKLWSS